ncbi:unnamed protein product, partial [Lepidochelys kempii]
EPQFLPRHRSVRFSPLGSFPPSLKARMKSLLLFLSLFSTLVFVLSQVQLRQSGSAMLKPGETLTLTCTISGPSSDTLSSSCCWWTWIRQEPGKGLEWMGDVSKEGTTHYAPSLQSRVTISAEPAKNQFSLQLRSPAAADTAKYYCVRRRT